MGRHRHLHGLKTMKSSWWSLVPDIPPKFLGKWINYSVFGGQVGDLGLDFSDEDILAKFPGKEPSTKLSGARKVA